MGRWPTSEASLVVELLLDRLHLYLAYEFEVWIIRARDLSRITAGEMGFMKRTVDYRHTSCDHKKNEQILKQLNTECKLTYLKLQGQNWKNHINRMNRKRNPR